MCEQEAPVAYSYPATTGRSRHPMENPGQRDRRALLAEAERIRKEVRTLKRQRERDPHNEALVDEYDRLRARYSRIERMLAGEDADSLQPATPEPPPTMPDSGLAPFEPKPPALAVEPRGPVVQPPPRAPRTDWNALAGRIAMGIRVVRIAITSVLLLFILAFVYLYAIQDMRFFIVPTRSMQPTFNPMDRIVTVKARDYKPGDIVVFPDPDFPGDFLVKRIVAVAGDSVAVVNRMLVVNHELVREPYLAEPMEFAFHPVIVPHGEVFVLGDNRNASEDSKDWGGGIAESSIRGRVAFIYMPLERFQRVAHARPAFSAP